MHVYHSIILIFSGYLLHCLNMNLSKAQHNAMEIMDSTNNKAKQKTDFVWVPYAKLVFLENQHCILNIKDIFMPKKPVDFISITDGPVYFEQVGISTYLGKQLCLFPSNVTFITSSLTYPKLTNIKCFESHQNI